MNTPMNCRELGRSGLQVSPICFGGNVFGWTMAAGTGRVIADIVSGRQPDIDISGLGMARYG